MHDCVKTRELLVDLVFDELEPEARRRALLELEGCPDCLAQYRSMTDALRVFDQVTETAMPEESYWPGYETRLREGLRSERPSWTRRLADRIGGFGVVAMTSSCDSGFGCGVGVFVATSGTPGEGPTTCRRCHVHQPIARNTIANPTATGIGLIANSPKPPIRSANRRVQLGRSDRNPSRNRVS
jgi:hypothetical protein